MTIRINPLTSDEVQELKKLSVYDRRCRRRIRAKIILETNQGGSAPVVATRLGCHVTTVRRWIKRWNQRGLAALTQADCLTDQTWKQKRGQALKLLFRQDPAKLGLPFTTWTCRTVAAFCRDALSLNWTYQQVWNYLKQAGLRYRKVETRFLNKPVGYDLWKAAKRLLDRFQPSDTLVLYLDEKGALSVTRYGGHCWSEEPQRIDLRQPIHGKLHLLGAYDFQTDRIWLIPMDNKDSGEFCDAVSKLWVQLTHRRWKHVIFIMDNASYHRSKYTTNYLTSLPNCHVLFLPPYSPELNPIEQRFRQYTKEVLELGTFSSKLDLIDATKSWELYYNTLRAEIFSNGDGIQMNA